MSNKQKEKELGQLHNKFINECKYSFCLRPETTRGYENVFDLFLKIMPEVTCPDSLTSSIMVEFFKRIETRSRKVGKIMKTGVKKSTIKTYRAKLNTFFNWLKENDYIKENPMKNFKPISVSYDDYKRLKDNELDKIYSSIVNYSINPLILRRDTMMISLLLYTGARKGEFISLKIKDLDLIKKEIIIKGETSKSKVSRTLHIHPTLLMHIKDYLVERNKLSYKTEYLIVSSRSDRGLSREGLKHWVQGIIKKSGVKFHLHMFRHTFASKITENGTPSLALQKLMGHKTIAMTSRYTRSLNSRNMREDIERISF